MLEFLLSHPWYDLAAALTVYVVWRSFRRIGPTEVGLVTKRFSWKKLSEDSPVAFNGEAGCQADLLMPGLRWKLWLLYSVNKFPWVQVPAGEIGVVIAQVGQPLPIGAKSAVFRKEFGNFADLRNFVTRGAEGCTAAGAAAGHARAHPSRRLPGDYAQPSLRPARLVRVAQQDRQGWQPHPHVRRTPADGMDGQERTSTRLNSSHVATTYAV